MTDPLPPLRMRTVALAASWVGQGRRLEMVQLTPPGSACSIMIGSGLQALADMAPGAIKGLHLVVRDIAEARNELINGGVEVDDIDDSAGGGVRYASFCDPDGNSLVLQEMAWRTGDAF